MRFTLWVLLFGGFTLEIDTVLIGFASNMACAIKNIRTKAKEVLLVLGGTDLCPIFR